MTLLCPRIDKIKALNWSPVTCGLWGDVEFSQSAKIDEGGRGTRNMKNEDIIKNNYSFLSLCTFRKIPGREAFMQALPLEIKRNLEVINIEIIPLQTDTEPNDYSTGSKAVREPSIATSSLSWKDESHIPIDDHITKTPKNRTLYN